MTGAPQPTGAHWNGDEWRWHRWSQPATSPTTIYVIEPSSDAEAKREEAAKDRTSVPFGFARAIPAPDHAEPTLWEGDQA